MRILWILFFLSFFTGISYSQQVNVISVRGTRFYLNDEPFPYTGVSFFNAIYNPEFNKDHETRVAWLEKFRRYGINVFRIWAQWDNKRGFVDTCPGCTLYTMDGNLREDHLKTLKEIISDAGSKEMVILLTLFQRESWNEDIRLPEDAADRAVGAITRALKPYRNLVFQVWNEFDHRTVDFYRIIKDNDPDRLVTNSPGYAGVLGSPGENRTLDFLSPHTTRDTRRHWNVAPEEIRYLLSKYDKPVVDDEPARKGTQKFGGPSDDTDPFDHILHMMRVLDAGGYVIYHHDMFQTGYGSDAVPPSGIPDPEFDPYHRQAFEFLRVKSRYY